MINISNRDTLIMLISQENYNKFLSLIMKENADSSFDNIYTTYCIRNTLKNAFMFIILITKVEGVTIKLNTKLSDYFPLSTFF